MTGSASAGEQKGILANTAVMAAGTVFSRASGLIRATLLAAALGTFLHADIFTVANTVPNMLYILIAGGVFNAVLVPQLVRSMKNDPDGGAAYVNRVITLAACFLGAASVLLVVAAPVVIDVMMPKLDAPHYVEQHQSAIDFARYCLPQVFFYGMFVLLGQVLNARGRFGPMMWAPIANNVISVAVLVGYIVAFGTVGPDERIAAFSSQQELLLGLGSTAGIAAQFLILIPYLRAAGIRYRPRFDWRGVGLGHTLRLGVWTVLFVIANQIAYVVVVRLASGGTAESHDGTGITIYSNVFQVVMVPHSVITVSLATAILPRLSSAAANGDLSRLATTLSGTMRTALSVVVPFAALLATIASPLSQVLWGHGGSATTYYRFEPSLVLFGFGIIAFTVHYLVLRAFYALELNKLVFFIQCAIAATNILLAVLLVGRVAPWETSPMLVIAYTGAYAVGSAISGFVLVRRLRRGGAPDGRRAWRGFVLRLVTASVVVYLVAGFVDLVVGDTIAEIFGAHAHWTLAAVEVAVVCAAAGVTLVAVARPLRLTEVSSVVDTVLGRLQRR